MRHDCYSIPMPIWPKGAHIPQMKILIFLLSHFPLLIKSLSFWKHWQQKYEGQGVPLYWEGSFPGGPEESLWVPQSQVSILHWHKWDLNQVIDFHNCFVYWVPLIFGIPWFSFSWKKSNERYKTLVMHLQITITKSICILEPIPLGSHLKTLWRKLKPSFSVEICIKIPSKL